jgi:hypothetical protein
MKNKTQLELTTQREAFKQSNEFKLTKNEIWEDISNTLVSILDYSDFDDLKIIEQTWISQEKLNCMRKVYLEFLRQDGKKDLIEVQENIKNDVGLLSKKILIELINQNIENNYFLEYCLTNIIKCNYIQDDTGFLKNLINENVSNYNFLIFCLPNIIESNTNIQDDTEFLKNLINENLNDYKFIESCLPKIIQSNQNIQDDTEFLQKLIDENLSNDNFLYFFILNIKKEENNELRTKKMII